MEQSHTERLAALSSGMAEAVEQVSPSLVLVDGRQRQAASGVVFAEELVLTADHVLEREEDLAVQSHDQRRLPAQFVGRDPSSDLAVLRVPSLNLPPALFPSTEARVGELVLAVGRPFNGGPMASLGIVCDRGGPLRTGRRAMLARYLRTDAVPYPGFSGGALVRAGGEVVGILTTGLVRGVTLAVPAAVALGIGEALSQQGRVRRGYLGISSQPVHLPAEQRGGLEQEGGLLVVRVEEGSPAASGSILVGDILMTLDGQPLVDTADLQLILTGGRVGQTLPLQLLRGGNLLSLQVTIAERDPQG